MATKRFTDTEKWKDPFFDELTNDYKLVWLYLLDDCDNAGVFSVNLRRLNFSCNVTLTPKIILETFNGRIIPISEDRWLIPSFMVFQYGTEWMNSKNKAVESARKKLKELGILSDDNRLLIDLQKTTDTPSIDYTSTIDSPSIDYKETIDRPKDKDKDESKEQSKDENKVEPKEEESITSKFDSIFE